MIKYGRRTAYGRRRRPSQARFWARRILAVVALIAVGLGAWWVVASALGSGGGPRAVATSAPPTRSPSPSPTPSPSPAIPPLPACVMGDTPAERTAYRDWERTLLDTDFSLDASYVPPELASTTEAGFVEDLQVRPFVIEHLAALRAAAEAVGTPVALIAAYRSYEDQQLLFDQRVVELGQEEAESKVARAGHSEHQLGTAVDFKLPDHADVTERFATTGGGKWLAENAWQYGFILSFPDELRATTCYGFEPWHYRYFGIEMARAIRESGLTSREYLWSLQSGVTP